MENKKLMFYNLIEFYEKKERIKEEYDKLSDDEVMIYKMYVYSLPFEEEKIKDLMWEYLNEWDESSEELERQYEIKINKREKMKWKY